MDYANGFHYNQNIPWIMQMVQYLLWCDDVVCFESILPIFVRVISLAMGQSCPSASEVHLKHMGKYIKGIYKRIKL